MKAVIYTSYGGPDVMRITDVEKPVPKNDEVLLKVRAASVNPLDSGSSRHPFLRRILFAMSKSKIDRPGRDVAGQVEALGSNVTQFQPGDAVFGLCGGAFAEYACASASALVMKPANA